MNNRFKFRIWWESHQKYLGNQMFLTMTGGKIWAGMTIPVLPKEEDDFIIEQCTGLKDKNGNLIYEGDIIQNPNKDQYIVEWIVDGYWHIRQADDEKFGCALASVKTLYDGWEIIGNIHETKRETKCC